MIKVALIPIDNRPICYDLIKDVLAFDDSIELFMPEINTLGGLYNQSNIDEIFNFINKLEDIDYLIVSLDTIAYGGLVSSRRCEDSFDVIKKRIEKFKTLAQKRARKILAFSSVMRISNNNINEEEKTYWAQWGKRIFDWSYYLHKSECEKTFNCVLNKIPQDILDDYLNTRKRNFDINKIYLNWAKTGFFDTLIFSKDDCAEFGLNVKEAQELEEIINKEKISCAKIKTGADEIPLSLLTRALASGHGIKVSPLFIEENSVGLISKYEDISIENCTKAQIELAGLETDNKNPDIVLLVNNFKTQQGDLVLGDVINSLDKKICFPDAPFAIADVNNANGADCGLISRIFEQESNNFYGYCGYNTSANTIGCTIFAAVVKFLALKKEKFNKEAFKKFEFIRFLDDWGYQAISRKEIREAAPLFSEKLLEKENELKQNSEKISRFLDFYPKKIIYSLPWDRSFEIRIQIIN